MTLREKRLKFLNETIEFYNLANRAMGSDGGCCYSPIGNSPGCAIGRHLIKDLSRSLDDHLEKSVGYDHIFDRLPDELKELGKYFLTDIQNLHDREINWDENGLSAIGVKKVRDLKMLYDLD